VRYSTGLAPPGIVGFMGLMAALGIFVLVLSLLQGGPAWFAAVYLVAVAGLSYCFLWLFSYELVIESGLLHWRTPFRHGVQQMDGAARVDKWGPMGDVHVFVFRDGTRVHIPVVQRYVAFLGHVHELYPDLPLPSTGYARIVDQVRPPGMGRQHDLPPTALGMTAEERVSRRRLAGDALAALQGESDEAVSAARALADQFVDGAIDLEAMLAGVSRLRGGSKD